jgi:diguanylate cyclase (GGDEF)-like protein/PAS domain S-box-containing protein
VKQAWQLALNRQDFDDEHRVIVHDTVRWIHQKAELDFDDSNHAVRAVGTTQDITELKSAQLALKTSEERYRTMIEWSPEAILVHRGGIILYANPAAIRLFGASYAQILLDTPTSKLIHPDSLAEQSARMKSICNHETIQPMVEAKFLRLDGSVIDVEVQGTAIDYDDDLAIHVVIHDITQRKKMESQVRRLAFYDALTQLPNRRLLTERLIHALAACRRSGNFGAVMFLDLDNFKPLNDHFGHSMGDLLLMEAARRLKTCVREMDTVARFGGDEFVVVVEELAADRSEAERLAHSLAEKIRACLSEPYALKKPNAEGLTKSVTHHCTTSIGVAMIARNEDSPDDLVKWADAAMYQAKNGGRNRIRFFSAREMMAA